MQQIPTLARCNALQPIHQSRAIIFAPKLVPVGRTSFGPLSSKVWGRNTNSVVPQWRLRTVVVHAFIGTSATFLYFLRKRFPINRVPLFTQKWFGECILRKERFFIWAQGRSEIRASAWGASVTLFAVRLGPNGFEKLDPRKWPK